MAKATYAKNFRSFRAFRGQTNTLRLSAFAFSKYSVSNDFHRDSPSYDPPMILRSSSVDPIVPGREVERIYNGLTTDLERT